MTTLGDKLETEMPAIVVKCNRAYLEASKRWGSKNIWTVLPQYFHNTRAEMAQAVNSIEAFLASNEMVKDETSFVRLREFRDAWKAFAMSNGYIISNKVITNNLFKTPFERHGIQLVNDTREYRNEPSKKDNWVVGVRLLDGEFDTGGGLDG